MKIVHIETLISTGQFAVSREWRRTQTEIYAAITSAEWPPGSGAFTIHPTSGKQRGEGNGVVPIKARCIAQLVANGWASEASVPLTQDFQSGRFDAVLKSERGLVALEWETGNISSSHRALNKLAIGLMKGGLIAAILVLPSKQLARWLTDRIGNYPELIPYLDLWRAIPCREGVMEIVVIEQDAESTNVPRIPKGTDGRARG